MKLSQTDIALLVQNQVIPEGVPPGRLELFRRFCEEKKLNPLTKQIYLQKFTTTTQSKKDATKKEYVVSYQEFTSIDGYRALAARTSRYAGSDDALYNNGANEYSVRNEYALKGEKDYVHPITATVTIYAMIEGVRCPFTATASWDSYVPVGTKDFMWRKMPFLMLAKCAEALALRKAFPEDLGQIYINEEINSFTKMEPLEVEEKDLEDPLVESEEYNSFIESIRAHIAQCDQTDKETIGKYKSIGLKCQREFSSGTFRKSSLDDAQKKIKSIKAK